MMKRIMIFLFWILFLPAFTLADNSSSIQLSKYYQASCASYTGTWDGFFTDPTDLFGNGGPWPVQVSLYNNSNNIIGQANASKAPSFVSKALTGTVWAQCQNGQLSNIFLGNKNQCGAFSQTGLLVSKNVLIMQINYQNAMTGAPFLLVLKRVNNNYSGKIPQNASDMQLGSVESCH